jgi:mono/diheme cytochrome c family protein
MNRLSLLSCLALLPGVAHADTPQQILAAYQKQAGSASAARGEKFFLAKLTRPNGEVGGCASCHTENPKAIGKTRAQKSIEPLAPVANRERFTDPAKVEKWFKRNCKDVLDRECAVQEKADFVAFLISVK